MKPTLLAKYLSRYLQQYLPGIRGFSQNTIASKRDSFILLFRFLKEEKNYSPDDVDIPTLTKETVLNFLDWLEFARSCSVATRNLRLSAIKSFFSYLQTETPDYLFQCQQIIAIPRKKTSVQELRYLSLDGIKAILDAVNVSEKEGLRDLALLTLMYDSAARIQELADLCVKDIRFQKPYIVHLSGKGNKTRVVPLMEKTADLLQRYQSYAHPHFRGETEVPFFYNRCGKKLTRAGITYIFDKHVSAARLVSPELIPEAVSPHGFRHSKSMHMLQAGVPLIYIRDFLGHVEISTTEIYARCDSKQKREAIMAASTDMVRAELPVWSEDIDLMKWLQSLC